MPIVNQVLYIGETIVNATAGSVIFTGTGNVVAQDNTNFFWDNTNKRLGIGTSSPDADVEIMISGASDIGMTIQSASSQSADCLRIIDSSGDPITSLLTGASTNGFIKFLTNNKTYGSSTVLTFIRNLSTTTLGTGSSISGVQFSGEFNFQGNSPFNLPGTFFQFGGNMRFSSSTNTFFGFGAYTNQATYIADGVTMDASFLVAGFFWDSPIYSVANSGSWGSSTGLVTSFQSSLVINTGVALGTRRSFLVADATGAGTLSTQIGLDIATLTKATTNIAIRTAAGGVIQFGNKITVYNNINTVSNGVPSELATVDLTTQSAAVSATTIYTPTATGLFRVSIYLQVTRAATSSSILGGGTGVVITYNDGDGNVAQTITAGLMVQNGTFASVNSGNTTTTSLNGSVVIYARTGVAIQYAIGYTSVGATSMQYAAHLKVEAL